MATEQKPSLNDSSQWSNDVGMPNTVRGYPNAWLKAEAALQKVQQTKKDSSPSVSLPSTTIQNNNTMNNASVYGYTYHQHQYWPQMYGFSGYPTAMPGYNNYYNMAAYQNMTPYHPYYGYPSMAATSSAGGVSSQNQMSQPPSSTPTENAPQPPESVALSDLANPPPPPPASPPPPSPEGQKPVFIPQRNKQAPGAGGIRFTMSKRAMPKGNGLLEMAKKKARNNQKGGGFDGIQNNTSFEHSFETFTPFKAFSPDKKDSDEEALEQMGFKSDEIANWPPSFKNYLKRCYGKCSTKLQRDRMAIILKGKLGQLIKNGSFWNKDWASEPILNLCNETANKEPECYPVREKPSQKLSPNLSKQRSYRNRFRSRSRSRSWSRSRSRSRSRSPSPCPRRVIRRRDHSSGSSSSSYSNDDSSNGSKKQSLSSSVVTPVDHHSSKQANSRSAKKKKKQQQQQQKKKMTFDLNPEELAENQVRLQQRAARFKPAVGKRGGSLVLTVNNFPAIGADEDETDIDWSSYAIVGTCKDVEKPFLRITSAVDPSSIRPQKVLEKSLSMVMERWKSSQDYFFACEQLKSIRQDLVVQCIRNNFTVKVYETHARIALEKGDRTEFNQCQSQLKVLYEELHEGDWDEFLAYRILYNMHTNDTRELKNIISSLSPADKHKSIINYALSLNLAWTLNNFHKFFKLYIAAPRMAGYIIDWFVASVRKTALKAYVKSYRPSLPVAFLEREFGFSSPQDCRSFLDEYSLVYTDDRSCLLCKESQASILA